MWNGETLKFSKACYYAEIARFPPAFLISHQNRLRKADFGDSFPPGEATAAFGGNPHNSIDTKPPRRETGRF